MNHLTMQHLEALGFELVKSYRYDNFVTQRRQKGCITVETTYDMGKNGKFESQELMIDDGEWREFLPEHLTILDNILNKTT